MISGASAAAYFPSGPGDTEAKFTQVMLSKGYQLNVDGSSRNLRKYKNLSTDWEVRASIKDGRITNYIVVMPYEMEFEDVHPTLIRKLGKPWQSGDKKAAWLTDSKTLTILQQSWLHYEIKSVDLNSKEGADLKAKVLTWSPVDKISSQAAQRPSGTQSTERSAIPPTRSYPNSKFQSSDDAEKYCMNVIEKQLGEGKIILSRGGAVSASRYEQGQLKSWVFKPRVRVMNTEYTADYHCILYDSGRIDIGPGW